MSLILFRYQMKWAEKKIKKNTIKINNKIVQRRIDNLDVAVSAAYESE